MFYMIVIARVLATAILYKILKNEWKNDIKL